MEWSGLQNGMRYLPRAVREAISCMPPEESAEIQEIRLRAERPAAICIQGTEFFLSGTGEKTRTEQGSIFVSQKELEQAFQAVCEYSVYRYAKEIQEGFITVSGGNRVGIAGSFVCRDGMPVQMRHISGLNFRIAHAVNGCAQELYARTCKVKPAGVLLIGAVGSGKTTMLRDFCRLAGNHFRVTLVDERSEIAAMHRGIPRYDVGLHTDVLDGIPRAEGLLTALRVMTPQLLICDEIGTEADAQAIARIHGCGVPVVASAHGASWKDLEQRRVLQTLLHAGVFSYGVLLQSDRPGQLQEIRSLQDQAGGRFAC